MFCLMSELNMHLKGCYMNYSYFNKNAVTASSRSGSPSSRLSYATYSAASRDGVPGDGVSTVGRPRRLSSGIPRSTGTSREASRETSPNRFSMTGVHDRSFGSKLR